MTKLLLARGDTVAGLARSPTSFEKVRKAGARAIEGVWTELDLLRAEAAKADAVIHCAFRHEEMATEYQRICEEDRAAIKVMAEGLESNERGEKQKTLIYISGTLSTTGPDEDDPKAVNDALPRHLSEKVTFEAQSPKLRTLVVRLAPIVHDEDYLHDFLVQMIVAAKKYGYSGYLDAGNRWPSAHYDDVAELCILALDKAPSGKALHAVTEEGISTKEHAEWIGEELGVPIKTVPKGQALSHFGFVGFLLGLDNYTTNKKTKVWTGWEPKGAILFEDMRKRGIPEFK